VPPPACPPRGIRYQMRDHPVRNASADPGKSSEGLVSGNPVSAATRGRDQSTDYARRHHLLRDCGRGFDSRRLHQDRKAARLSGFSRSAASVPFGMGSSTLRGPATRSASGESSTPLWRAAVSRSERELVPLDDWHSRLEICVDSVTGGYLRDCLRIGLAVYCGDVTEGLLKSAR
jgi:hypothetical protein